MIIDFISEVERRNCMTLISFACKLRLSLNRSQANFFAVLVTKPSGKVLFTFFLDLFSAISQHIEIRSAFAGIPNKEKRDFLLKSHQES